MRKFGHFKFERLLNFAPILYSNICHFSALLFLINYEVWSLLLDNDADGRLRHAFIGIGFRERTEAYDFQAALHDHMKYPSI